MVLSLRRWPHGRELGTIILKIKITAYILGRFRLFVKLFLLACKTLSSYSSIEIGEFIFGL
jgi:hypothetical protein